MPGSPSITTARGSAAVSARSASSAKTSSARPTSGCTGQIRSVGTCDQDGSAMSDSTSIVGACWAAEGAGWTIRGPPRSTRRGGELRENGEREVLRFAGAFRAGAERDDKVRTHIRADYGDRVGDTFFGLR